MKSIKKPTGVIRWRLKELMDFHKVSTSELAECLEVNINTVCRWRRAEVLPEINEKRWVQIVAALNHLSDRGAGIDLWDLVEFCPQEVRSDNVFDYQYASGERRKVPVTAKK